MRGDVAQNDGRAGHAGRHHTLLETFVRALRAGQLSVIADCVHAYLESPEPYNEHLDRWLGTVYPLEEPG